MAAVKGGINVEDEPQKARDEDYFAQIFENWIDQFAKPHKKSWREDQRRFVLCMK